MDETTETLHYQPEEIPPQEDEELTEREMEMVAGGTIVNSDPA